MLGDCWMLSSASSLAEHPERIKMLFTNEEYDSAGIFQLNFWNKGEQIKITVDDRLPINEGRSKTLINTK